MESLEQRTLLSGLTLITHGLEGSATSELNWLNQMGSALVARANAAEGGATAEIVISATERTANGPITVQAVTSSVPANYNGEIVMELDWRSLSNPATTPTIGTQAVADAVANYLYTATVNGNSVLEGAIQLIGHSRGGSLVTALAYDLGTHGIWVDQVTTLDPHPFAQDYRVPGQTPAPSAGDNGYEVQLFDNVIFADNYYQDVAANFYTGTPVAGAYNVDLASLPGVGHNMVHTYYDGTIETTATNDTDGGTINPTWYTTSPFGPRQSAGYALSRIGEIISNTARPLEGVGADFGGDGYRYPMAPASETGTQWPNIGLLNAGGPAQLLAGQSTQLSFDYSDRSGPANVTLFLDTDQNPYNTFVAGDPAYSPGSDALSKSFGRGYDASLPQASNPTPATISVDTNGLAVGSYFVCAEINDGSHRRFVYLPEKLTISAPVPAAPTITSVAQAIVTNLPLGQPQVITLAGNGFLASTTLAFSNGTQMMADVVANLTVNSSTQLQYTVPSGMSPGQWTVQAANPGSALSNPISFFVDSTPGPEATSTYDLQAGQIFLTDSPTGTMPITSPQVGQTVYLRCPWNFVGSGGDFTNVPYSINLDGSVFDAPATSSITGAPGSGVLTDPRPWVVTPGQHTFQINLDSPSIVGEFDETNNASSVTVMAVSAPTISISNSRLPEGNSGRSPAMFALTLSAASTQTVSVNYTTHDGTATIADGDYQSATGMVVFAPGQTSRSIAVLVNGDIQVEPDETFTLNLSNPTNATIGDAQGIGTIVNDDFPPVAAAGGPYTVPEGGKVVLSSSGSHAMVGSLVKEEWDFNYDGNPAHFVAAATGATATFTAAAIDGPATRTVALRVTDSNGLTAIATAKVSIVNVAPTATFTGSTLVVGATGTVSFTHAFDPSSDDVAAGFRYSYDFNNDSVFEIVNSTSPTVTVPAKYLATTGAHIIRGRITDEDGGFTDYTAVVQVNSATLKAPVISVGAGTYVNSITVSLVSPTAGAAIHYTLDGTTPTAASPLYTTPLVISASKTLNAIAIETGLPNSPIASAAYTIVPSSSITTLTSGKAVSNLSGTLGSVHYFAITVPAGTSKLTLSITGGTGDGNLYLRRSSLPSRQTYDARSVLAGNTDVITLLNPVAGTYYVMLYGYETYSGVTIDGVYA